MTADPLAATVDITIVAATVAFVLLVGVAALRSPVSWLAWPPRLLIALAGFIGAAFLTDAALTPAVSPVVAGGSWLTLAAFLAWTRLWLHRRVRARLRTITSRGGDAR